MTALQMRCLPEDVRNAAIQAGAADGSVLGLAPALCIWQTSAPASGRVPQREVNCDDIQ